MWAKKYGTEEKEEKNMDNNLQTERTTQDDRKDACIKVKQDMDLIKK